MTKDWEDTWARQKRTAKCPHEVTFCKHCNTHHCLICGVAHIPEEKETPREGEKSPVGA